ncbi:hypothetical protein FRB97_003613 [Tulasnella sp. 331]|nr:hypothetical protein FRB97_003613 [Tulasnella sp. 331]
MGWQTAFGKQATGISLFYTGSPTCHGIQVVSNIFSSATSMPSITGSSSWSPTTCLSNTTEHPWAIDTTSAFAVSSAASNSLSEVRLFYWSRNTAGQTVIKDAYWNPLVESKHLNRRGVATSTSASVSPSSTSSVVANANAATFAGKYNLNQNTNMMNNNDHNTNAYRAAGTWEAGKLALIVDSAWTEGLTAVSWVNTTTGGIGRRIFYVQAGWLKEMTLMDGGEWTNQGREGIQLFFNPGGLSATSYYDVNGVLQIRVYVLNADTNELVEFHWDSFNSYTMNSDVSASSTAVSTDVGSVSTTIHPTDGGFIPSVYTTASTHGGQGGVTEQVLGTGTGTIINKTSCAAADSRTAAASLSFVGAPPFFVANVVFFLDTNGRLRQTPGIFGDWVDSDYVSVHV